MNPARSSLYALILPVSFILPLAIPGVGLELNYFFIFIIVLLAWFVFKWEIVKSIERKSRPLEMALAIGIIGADYAYNAIRASTVGLVDLLVIFLAVGMLTFGVKALKAFWVPAAYGVILLAGYQLENLLPNYSALQNWLAADMAFLVNLMGIKATVYGEVVGMKLANGTPVLLDISGACTGLQGILAFGLLSTMTLLDMKPRMSRLIPLFAIGFIGAFLINIVRLFVVFLTFEYAGVDVGTWMHVYFGYLIFIAWVLVFWAFAFRYLSNVPAKTTTALSQLPATSGPRHPLGD